jgi:LDH2 family malate/lactate/ureidoglycolate dehydrogenase
LEEMIKLRIMAPELERFCISVFEAVGVPHNEAVIISHNLVEADLRGSSSHGVMRVPIYANRIKAGSIKPNCNVEVLQETPVSAHLDGNHGIGQVVAQQAMALCIEKSKMNGVAVVAVKRSNHFGMALSYSTMALAHDMIGIVFTSPAAKLMAPWGGIDPILDNNPISFAIPAGKEFAVVLDMATTVVSRGKIGVAAKRGERIPLDWALTSDGHSTDDPNKAFDGVLLPAGGYKGYGLTVISGILSGLLPGAAILSNEIADFYNDISLHQNIGHLFCAIRIDLFSPVEQFKEKMDKMIHEIRNSRRAPGVDRIFLPGERGYRTAEKNRLEGILLPKTVVKELNELGAEYNLGKILSLGG